MRAIVTLRMSSFQIISQEKRKQVKLNGSNLTKLPHEKHYPERQSANKKKLTFKLEGELYLFCYIYNNFNRKLHKPLMSILRSVFQALSVYEDGAWISVKTPKEINDKLLPQRLYLILLSYL